MEVKKDMKRNKILLISFLVIFCLSISAVNATDIDDNAVLTENQDNLLIGENNNLSTSNQEKLIEEDNSSTSNQNESIENDGYAIIGQSDLYRSTFGYIEYIMINGRLPDQVKVLGVTMSVSTYTLALVKLIKDFPGGILIEPAKVSDYNTTEINKYMTASNYLAVASFVMIYEFHNKGQLPSYIVNTGYRYPYYREEPISFDVYSYLLARIALTKALNKGYPDTMLVTSIPFFDQSYHNSTGEHIYDYDEWLKNHESNHNDSHNNSNNDYNMNQCNLPNTGNSLAALILALCILPLSLRRKF